MSAPAVTPELRALLRRVKLGRCLDTLPERLAHAEFLELVLADEVSRRETTSADRRARAAGLDPAMTLDRWDDTAKVTYDRGHLERAVLAALRRWRPQCRDHGPVGVGKTFLATALGHAAVRRRYPVHFERCDRLLKRLRASRLDNSHDTEMRKLLRVDLLIIDDFALQPLDALDTADVYELIVERHRAAATVVTSNREPIEWLGLMADPLLAQSPSTGCSPPPTSSCSTASPTGNAKSPASSSTTTARLTHRPRPDNHPAADVDIPVMWSHATGARVVPSSWRTTPGPFRPGETALAAVGEGVE